MKNTLIILIAVLSSCVAVRNPLEGQQFISSRNHRAVDGGNIINEEYVLISFEKGSITFNYQDSTENITVNAIFQPSITNHPYFVVENTNHSIIMNMRAGTMEVDEFNLNTQQSTMYRQFSNLKTTKP